MQEFLFKRSHVEERLGVPRGLGDLIGEGGAGSDGCSPSFLFNTLGGDGRQREYRGKEEKREREPGRTLKRWRQSHRQEEPYHGRDPKRSGAITRGLWSWIRGSFSTNLDPLESKGHDRNRDWEFSRVVPEVSRGGRKLIFPSRGQSHPFVPITRIKPGGIAHCGKDAAGIPNPWAQRKDLGGVQGCTPSS